MSWTNEQAADTTRAVYYLPEDTEDIELVPPVVGPATWVLLDDDHLKITRGEVVDHYHRRPDMMTFELRQAEES